MQPIYLTGHSRPVQKVQFNYDGDLLFTCSDDKSVCMYSTQMLNRVGLFQINDSCKSIDVTKDSKYLFATATTKGIKIFNVANGDLISELTIGAMQTKQVELSFSDKYFAVLYEEKSRETFIKIFNTKEALEWGKKEGCPKPICTINGPKDHGINCVKWGKFDETVLYATDKGRLLQYNIEEEQVVKARDVNRNEIFTI